ncbi:hypothetical protein ABTJ77_19655, partial [Acinetobacter baumannii]
MFGLYAAGLVPALLVSRCDDAAKSGGTLAAVFKVALSRSLAVQFKSMMVALRGLLMDSRNCDGVRPKAFLNAELK